jgi:hypothetical protein
MKVRTIALSACLAVAQLIVPGLVRAQYQVTNLVSNQEKTANTTDPLLVNAWGLTHAPGSPWWVSDEGSGWSTLYDNHGTKESLDGLFPRKARMVPVSPPAPFSTDHPTSKLRALQLSSCSPLWTAPSVVGRRR